LLQRSDDEKICNIKRRRKRKPVPGGSGASHEREGYALIREDLSNFNVKISSELGMREEEGIAGRLAHVT